MEKHLYIALSILLTFPSLLAAINYTLPKPITNIVVGSDGEVLVTSGRVLHSLNSQLQLSSSFDFGNSYSDVTGLAVRGSSTIIACLAPGSTCAVFDLQQNSDRQLLSEQEPIYTSGIDSRLSPLSLIPTGGQAYFTAGSGRLPIYRWITENVAFLGHLYYGNSTHDNAGIWQWQKLALTKSGYDREIVGGFEYNSMVYFIALDSTSTGRTLAVIRTCSQTALDNRPLFSAVYEAALSSIQLNATSNVVNVQLARNFAQMSDDLLVLTISSKNSGRNGIYAIRMSDIDNSMEAVFKDCKKKGPPKSFIFTPPWSHVEIDCDNFGEVRSEFFIY